MIGPPSEVIDHRPLHRQVVMRWLMGVGKDGAELAVEVRVAFWRRPHRAYVAHRSWVRLAPGTRTDLEVVELLRIPAQRYSADGFTSACMSAQAMMCQGGR